MRTQSLHAAHWLLNYVCNIYGSEVAMKIMMTY